MEDARTRVVTATAINLSQLDAELGGHGLCSTASEGETEIVVVEGSPVTREELEAAIAAHVARPAPLSELATYKANVQSAIAQRDGADAGRDDWLLDLELRLLALEG